MLIPSVNTDFLDLFYNCLESNIGTTKSTINLRILRIENNEFCYHDLVQKLFNAVIPFSVSRNEIDNFKLAKRDGELYVKAVEKLRDYNINEGEAGELLLFCFLETHLKAPKILTKLEIKMSSNDYAKGSDGVHLLKLNDNKYHLIFGESKLDANITTSISNAFKSISEFIKRKKNNLNSELSLVNSQLCKESFNEELYQFLKTILIPTANSSNPIHKDNAFAIFAGFEIQHSKEEASLDNDAFREMICTKIKSEVEGKISHITKKIEEYNLQGYTFYVYAFPFTKIDDNRKRIIENLILSKNDY
jgi:Domain of unknown function (DUF1837).